MIQIKTIKRMLAIILEFLEKEKAINLLTALLNVEGTHSSFKATIKSLLDNISAKE